MKSNWKTAEPNGDTNENCAVMINSQFSDVPCEYKYCGICNIKSTPTFLLRGDDFFEILKNTHQKLCFIFERFMPWVKVWCTLWLDWRANIPRKIHFSRFFHILSSLGRVKTALETWVQRVTRNSTSHGVYN